MVDPNSLSAILGGTPVHTGEGWPWPIFDEEIEQILQSAFRDGSWGHYHGPHLPALEEALRQFFEVDQVLTCASGTLAVEAALQAMQVGPGDEVLLAAYDYEANFLNIHAVGAMPILIDVHPSNWNFDPSQMESAITPKTKAILVSHLHGGCVAMRSVMEWARAHRIYVIEDAAQCPGAMIQGRQAGSWGDIGILSFGGSKLLSAGRGGAMLFRDATLYQRAKVWLSRGVQQWAVLSELQAAVLLPQIRKLAERTTHRQKMVQELVQRIDVPGLQLFQNNVIDCLPAYYKVGFQYDAETFGLPRSHFLAAVRKEGIPFSEGFRALHIGRSKSRYRVVGPLLEAERANHGVVKLHHPLLLIGLSAVEQVVTALQKTYRNADRIRLLPIGA